MFAYANRYWFHFQPGPELNTGGYSIKMGNYNKKEEENKGVVFCYSKNQYYWAHDILNIIMQQFSSTYNNWMLNDTWEGHNITTNEISIVH